MSSIAIILAVASLHTTPAERPVARVYRPTPVAVESKPEARKQAPKTTFVFEVAP